MVIREKRDGGWAEGRLRIDLDGIWIVRAEEEGEYEDEAMEMIWHYSIKTHSVISSRLYCNCYWEIRTLGTHISIERCTRHSGGRHSICSETLPRCRRQL